MTLDDVAAIFDFAYGVAEEAGARDSLCCISYIKARKGIGGCGTAYDSTLTHRPCTHARKGTSGCGKAYDFVNSRTTTAGKMSGEELDRISRPKHQRPLCC